MICNLQFSEEDAKNFSVKLWDLLKLQAWKYNGIDSTSMPVEKAQELLSSLIYTISVVVKEDGLVAENLLQSDLPQLIKALPDDISYLQGYDVVNIAQGKKKSEFIITLLKKDDFESEKEMVLNSKEKERLELYLIANPDVRYNMRYEDSFIVDLMKMF